MAEQPTGRSRHVELSLDQLVELQPGLGRLMPEVGRRFWVLYHAAAGGNWELAGYQFRQVNHLLNLGATTRPKMAVHLKAFQQGAMQALEAALQARDRQAFERAYHEAVALGNRFHELTGHPEIRWKLPAAPPDDLDLGPAPEG